MNKHPGETWHCRNVSGHGAALVQEGSQPEALNPRCSRGAIMKEKCKSPLFTHPDFLRAILCTARAWQRKRKITHSECKRSDGQSAEAVRELKGGHASALPVVLFDALTTTRWPSR
jgi:hypothetical protein